METLKTEYIYVLDFLDVTAEVLEEKPLPITDRNVEITVERRSDFYPEHKNSLEL